MLIAITGHANGIGAAITEAASKKGHTVLGFDLETGDNINDPDSIIEQVTLAEADVFINNAYAPGAQIVMLQKIFEEWRDDPTKTIINMGSKAKYFPGFPGVFSAASGAGGLSNAYVTAWPGSCGGGTIILVGYGCSIEHSLFNR